MDETRWLAVGVAFLVIVVAAVVGRHPRPQPRTATGLDKGATLFFSQDCSGCLVAQRNLEKSGLLHRVVTWQSDPALFESAAVTKVPTVAVVGDGGTAVFWEGVPSVRQLRRVARSSRGKDQSVSSEA